MGRLDTLVPVEDPFAWLVGQIAGRLTPSPDAALTLAGAPTDPAALQWFLAERFGVRKSIAELRAMARVDPAALVPPAERRR